MNSAYFRNSISFIFLGLIVVLGAFFMNTSNAFAAAGDIQITATREGDSGTLFGATVEVQCTGGTWTQLTGSPTTDVVGIVSATPQGASSCDNGDTIDIRVTKTGYVTDTVMAAGTYLSASDPNSYTVSDIQFQLKVVTADELGNPITAVSVIDFSISLYNGEQNDLSSGSNMYWAVTASNTTLTLQSSGYVDSESINTGFSDVSTSASGQTVITLGAHTARTTAIAAGENVTAQGMVYGHKMILTREGDGAPISGAAPSLAQWVEDGTTGIYYAAIPVVFDGGASPGFVSKSGYVNYVVNEIADRTTGSDPQVTDTFAGMLFQLKVVTTDELGNAIPASELDTKTFNGVAATTTSGANAYWAVTASNAGLVLSEDGYVNAGTTNTGFSDVSTSASGQTVITLGAHTAKSDAVSAGSSVTSKGLVFGQKVSVTRQSNNTAVSGATVTAGSSNTACTEDGSTGDYYCPVPVAQDGSVNDITVMATGYPTNTSGDTTNRTDGTSVQGSATVVLNDRSSGRVVGYQSGGSASVQRQEVVLPKSSLGSGICPIGLQLRTAMKQGSRSEEVKILQSQINRILAAKYNQAAGPIDGIFGPLTKQGVMRLQSVLRDDLSLNLGAAGVDGIVGPFTRAAINNSCGGN